MMTGNHTEKLEMSFARSSSVRNRAIVGGSGCGGESKEIGSARSPNVGP